MKMMDDLWWYVLLIQLTCMIYTSTTPPADEIASNPGIWDTGWW